MDLNEAPMSTATIKVEELSELKFAKLHSPKMKSIYWRHFGFPSNENDDIITKQNVVCMLCHKVLTNHGNTTNLRAHLQHRHKELFKQICIENAINVPPRKKYMSPSNSIPKRHHLSARRIKVEYIPHGRGQHNYMDSDSEQAVVNAAAQVEDDDQTMLYESMVPVTYDDDELVEDDVDNYTAKVEIQADGSSEPNIVIKPNKKFRSIKSEHENRGLLKKENVQSWQLDEALLDSIVCDIRNPETLYEPGMSSLLRLLHGQEIMPIETLKQQIRNQHASKFDSHSDFTKVMAHEKKFSLGFDHFTNIEQKRFISIYFNYINEEPTDNVVNQLHTTVEYNEYIVVSDMFIEFDLNNCTAALFSYDFDDLIKTYLRERNIPVILSYDLIIEKCLQQLFALSEVADVVEQVKDVMQRHAAEISCKEVDIPVRNDEFLWTYYEWLKFFAENISWSDDMQELVKSAETVTEAIGALVVTLDTLKGEEIPHISMIAPITAKIVSKKLSVTENDDDLMITLKRTIATIMQTYVIEDENLTIAALLDPRFHRLTNIIDIEGCIIALKKKFNDISGSQSDEGNAIIHATKSLPLKISSVLGSNSSSSSRKSNLELFFDLTESPKPPLIHIENSVETDLKRYRNEVFVSLDESPIAWWGKFGHIYSSLAPIAQSYQCVPGFVNLNFKKPLKQQISENTKRHMLVGDLIDPILYLNHHK